MNATEKKAKINARARELYSQNRESGRARAKAYYESNKQRIAEKRRKYYQDHKEICTRRVARYQRKLKEKKSLCSCKPIDAFLSTAKKHVCEGSPSLPKGTRTVLHV